MALLVRYRLNEVHSLQLNCCGSAGFVTEPQKAPALTRSQTVKAVTGKSRERRREPGSADEGEGRV
ncbi:hypothetical protein EYF80_006938 [Liparis tanakae]|uniref:Uncharacterized protein n=1 Tax=Liparis tanakae TaxID=230148 RepID=A0A4Z2IYW6_9TELE|nr:hypothetical protein EYF80_006938 [Liparis tanakae]